MSGLEASYSLIRCAQFERTLKAHLKGLSKRQQPDALKLFGDLLDLLRVSPQQIRGQGVAFVEKLEPEPWPGPTLASNRRGVYRLEGWAFWKAYVNFPYAQGAARKGRLLYAVEEANQAIYLLMLYSHAEYQGRPDDSYLEAVLRESGVPPR